MRSYFDGMMRYFEISGRSTRMQYWMFFVIQFVLTILAVVVDVILGGLPDPSAPSMPVTLFVAFVHFVPGITVGVRRLHDIGRSGFWYLLYLVPFAGLLLLYWACCASEPGSNAYDDPEPSRYEPRPSARGRKYMTIPNGVRMGSVAGRSSATSGDGTSGRFI